MRKILLIIMSLMLLFGCSKEETVYDIIKENKYVVIDVRTKQEYAEKHVKGSINIPYDQIGRDIKLDKDEIILVYCQSGRRSDIAYNTLKKMGYKVVYDLGSIDNVKLPME